MLHVVSIDAGGAGMKLYCKIKNTNAELVEMRCMTDMVLFCTACHGNPWDPKFYEQHIKVNADD